jgi:arabinofuranan 3-O-arabinosyltransferase
MAASAFDGNLSTSWTSSATDQHPVLTIRWRRPRAVSHITIVRPPSASSPLQVLVTGSGGQLRGGVVGASGELRFKPMRTRELRLAFTPPQLPLQISEVQIRGVPPLSGNGSAQVHFGCGQGPTIEVDGTHVPTRATGTVTDLLQGRAVPFSACSQVLVKQGGNGVVESTADPTGFDVQSIMLPGSGAASSASQAARSAPAASVRWTATSRVLRVAAIQRSYLVVRQNFNAGWQASIASRVLTPVQLDGWEQGWLLPAGTRGLVTLTYLPDAPYRAGLFGGLALLGLVIVIVLVPARRRRDRPAGGSANEGAVSRGPVGEPTHASHTLVARLAKTALAAAVVAALAFVGLWLGGYVGAALVPTATVVFVVAARRRATARYWRLLASRWLLPALVLAAAAGGVIAIATHQWGSTSGLSDVWWDKGPQLAGLIIVARLAAALASPLGGE